MGKYKLLSQKMKKIQIVFRTVWWAFLFWVARNAPTK